MNFRKINVGKDSLKQNCYIKKRSKFIFLIEIDYTFKLTENSNQKRNRKNKSQSL